MQPESLKITPLEKIISILSYVSMGFIGFIWIIIAYLCKRKLKYFLMYNICQSMVISIFLAILNLLLELIFNIFSHIPILDAIAGILNYIISIKIVRLTQIGLSFNIIELVVFLLLIYLITGICMGRLFYVPVLTKFLNRVMKRF